MKWLVQLYPRAWRRQYGREFTKLLEEYDTSLVTILDIVWGACDAHYQQWQTTRQLWPNALSFTMGVVLIALGLIFTLTGIHPFPMILSPGYLHTLTPILSLMIPILGLTTMMLHLFLGITGIKLLKEIRDSL